VALRGTPIDSIVAAILRMEGSSSPNSVNQAIYRQTGLYDPGHIEWSRWSAAQGATKVTIVGPDGKPRDWAAWPTEAQGEQAIANLLGVYASSNPGMTVQQAVFKYAPPSENNSALYASNLAEWTGIPTDTPLASVLSGGPLNPTRPPAAATSTPAEVPSIPASQTWWQAAWTRLVGLISPPAPRG
jgi:hypothetical protein